MTVLLDYQKAQEYSFINRMRIAATHLQNFRREWNSLKEEWDNVYVASGRLPDESFISPNIGLVKNDIVNGKDTFNVVKAIFDGNANYIIVLENLKNPS